MSTDTTTNPAVAALLRAARARIADKRHWTHGALARDRHGHDIEDDDPRAVRWCAAGAIAAGTFEITAYRFLNQTALTRFGSDIVSVNDKLGHAAVLACYDVAIARAGGITP